MLKNIIAIVATFALTGCAFFQGVLDASREKSAAIAQSFESEIAGEWTDESGKTVTIKQVAKGSTLVTVQRDGEQAFVANAAFSEGVEIGSSSDFKAMELQLTANEEPILLSEPGKLVSASRGWVWTKGLPKKVAEAETQKPKPLIESGAEYILRSKYSGWVLDNDGTKVYTYPLHETGIGPIQRWKFKHDEATDTYSIWNVHAKKYAYVAREDSLDKRPWILKLQSVNEEAAQKFKLTRRDGTFSAHEFHIWPVGEDLPLAVKRASLAVGGTGHYWKQDGSTVIGLSSENENKRAWEFLPLDNIDTFREPSAKIAFLNESGYIANFSVYYDGEEKFRKNRIPLQQMKDLIKGASNEFTTVLVPARADVRVKAEVGGFVGDDLDTIFDLNLGKLDAGSFTCFKAYATAFKPEYNQNCEQFGVKSIKIVNNTDEKLYAGWTSEIKWSLANMGAGVITGLVLDNANNLNSSFFRYFAIANVVGIELPKSMYEMFIDGGIEIDTKQHEVILRDNPWAQIGHAAQLNFKTSIKAVKYVAGWVEKTEAQTDQYKSEYIQYNPIIFVGDHLGGDTKTIMVVNESATKFWIIDSGVDDSWIVTDSHIIKADEDSLKSTDANATKTPVIAIK